MINNNDEQNQFIKLVKDITSKGFVRNNYREKLVDLSDIKLNLKGKKEIIYFFFLKSLDLILLTVFQLPKMAHSSSNLEHFGSLETLLLLEYFFHQLKHYYSIYTRSNTSMGWSPIT